MLIRTDAAVAIDDHVFSVLAEGEVVEVSAHELKTEVLSVESLPHGLSYPELDDLQKEAIVLALEEAFEKRLRAQRRLGEELHLVVGMLRRALLAPATLEDPLERANETVGALRFTVERAKAQLEALIKEAA